MGIPPKGSHRLRLGRVSLEGQVYLLTTRTVGRQPLLARPEAARVVLASLEWLAGQGRLGLYAAVVMPDHVHAVAGLGKGFDLAGVMGSFKGFTSRRINGALGRRGPVWQPGYHDHALRRDESLVEAVRYCLENPVRAGLVRDVREYPYRLCRWEV